MMRSMKPHYQKAAFMLSVARLDQLPPDTGAEVAIVGRSNAGKSSVINQLTQNASLARVSKTPGRTQHINLFSLGTTQRLADLPGYGYAKVPPKVKHEWEQLLDTYLRTRECLQGLVVVMDIRHPFKEFDHQLLYWASECELPVHILLNKADKLTHNHIQQTLQSVPQAIAAYKNPLTYQAFSAAKGLGIKELRDCLDQWFSY
jgi:GTP-binding protein